MVENHSKVSGENSRVSNSTDKNFNLPSNESFGKTGQTRNWSAPELYLSHSEIDSDGNKTTVGSEAFDNFQHTELLTGMKLDNKYRILDVLGEGAMAIVYDALDLQTGAKVAAKTLKFSEDSLVARFAREIEIHQQLKHPNIVEAYGCVQGPNNLCLFMMEKVDGKDLEECLESLYKFENLKDYSSILSQLCDGLEHAHQKGVIHRDLKPENIILQLEEDSIKLKILDFGVAKIQEDLQKLTKTGLVIGSPAYMSPEQCIGKKLSEKSDIYSVGVLAFELITGELPYDATDPITMMKAHCSPAIFPRQISEFREDTPAVETLQGIVNATLQFDPELRYQNINQLKTDLDKWWQEAEIGEPGQPSPFKFIPESDLPPKANEAQEPFKQDFSRLTELVDTQRKGQVDSLRENFKEGELPKQAFDWNQLKPVAIAIGIIALIAGGAFTLSLVKFNTPTNDMGDNSTQNPKTNTKSKESSSPNYSSKIKKQNSKVKKKKKRRKIIAPGWVQK